MASHLQALEAATGARAGWAATRTIELSCGVRCECPAGVTLSPTREVPKLVDGRLTFYDMTIRTSYTYRLGVPEAELTVVSGWMTEAEVVAVLHLFTTHGSAVLSELAPSPPPLFASTGPYPEVALQGADYPVLVGAQTELTLRHTQFYLHGRALRFFAVKGTSSIVVTDGITVIHAGEYSLDELPAVAHQLVTAAAARRGAPVVRIAVRRKRKQATRKRRRAPDEPTPPARPPPAHRPQGASALACRA